MRALVRKAIATSAAIDWTLQGLGMMRMYLRPTSMRIHVWMPEWKVPGVTEIHDHPYPLTSHIIAGVMGDVQFVRVQLGDDDLRTGLYDEHSITCGVGKDDACATKTVALRSRPRKVYAAGDGYHVGKAIPHLSAPLASGTVTVIDRGKFTPGENDRALVFSRHGEPFGSAVARPVTYDEWQLASNLAVRLIDQEAGE